MNALTIFYAFEQAFGLLNHTTHNMYAAARKGRREAKKYADEMEKRDRQVSVFRKAIVKRLQEKKTWASVDEKPDRYQTVHFADNERAYYGWWSGECWLALKDRSPCYQTTIKVSNVILWMPFPERPE